MVLCDLYVYYKKAPYLQVALHKRHHTSLRKVQDLTEKPNGQSNPENMVDEFFFSKVTAVILYLNMCKKNSSLLLPLERDMFPSHVH